MSRNYVYTELTNAIEQAMLVGGLESESTQISHFIAEHGERFHFDPEKGRYFINRKDLESKGVSDLILDLDVLVLVQL